MFLFCSTTSSDVKSSNTVIIISVICGVLFLVVCGVVFYRIKSLRRYDIIYGLDVIAFG